MRGGQQEELKHRQEGLDRAVARAEERASELAEQEQRVKQQAALTIEQTNEVEGSWNQLQTERDSMLRKASEVSTKTNLESTFVWPCIQCCFVRCACGLVAKLYYCVPVRESSMPMIVVAYLFDSAGGTRVRAVAA